MGQKIKNIIKNTDTVLLISGVLAVGSAIINPPGKEYLEFIDFRVLGLLFSLMAVVAGLSEEGIFVKMARFLIEKAGNLRKLTIILVGLCFFSSMFITNDVALITFVPLTLLILEKEEEKPMIRILVLETIAANLGSMLLPFGNPQNLYLYGAYNMQLGTFVGTMLPLWLVSLAGTLLLIFILIPAQKLDTGVADTKSANEKRSTVKSILYGLLFLLAVLSVLRLVSYLVVMGIVIVAFIIMDKSVLRKVDYVLLVTFLFFFIFVGNLSELEVVRTMMEQLLKGREIIVSIIASQCISNVPAALMLSGFTENGYELLKGVNIGGLGTLIASMASLITYKFYKGRAQANGGKYMACFTILGLIMLAVLFVFGSFF